MKRNLFLLLLFLASLWSAGAVARNVVKTDVCVYGGTSAGVIAAYTAIQQGKKAVLIEPSHRIGGMTTGGLGPSTSTPASARNTARRGLSSPLSRR